MFKACDNDNKCWLNSFFVRNDGEVLVPIHIIDNTNLISLKAVNATPCRSTGLRDLKRTKEFPDGEAIYENDIVKANNFKPAYYKVAFIEGGFCLINENFDIMPIDINTLYPSIGCQIKKVGNTFQNEHLRRSN